MGNSTNGTDLIMATRPVESERVQLINAWGKLGVSTIAMLGVLWILHDFVQLLPQMFDFSTAVASTVDTLRATNLILGQIAEILEDLYETYKG